MPDKNSPADQKAFFQEWLEKLQQESWQLELLISGFALYGVYGSKEAISDFSNYIDISSAEGVVSFAANFAVTALRAGWALFFINLLVHIILRGLWIGAIGLRYVSREIDYDALNYSEWMTDYLRRKVGNYDDYIERLEKLCSVLFAYTFLLFFLVISAIAYFASVALIGYLTTQVIDNDPIKQGVLGILFLFYIIASFVVFFDFVTLGLIRRVKDPLFAKGYGYLYMFFSFITLSFLYRAILYNFLDEKYTRRLFLLGIPYVLLVLVVAPTIYTNGNAVVPVQGLISTEVERAVSGDMVRHQYYDDQRQHLSKATPIRAVSMDKYKYESRMMELFVRIDQDFDEILRVDAGLDPIFKIGLQSSIGSKVHKSAVVDSIRDLEGTLQDPLVKAKSAKRARLKEQGTYDQKAKRNLKEEFEILYDSVEYMIDTMIFNYYQQQFYQVKASLINRIDVSIDGRAVDIDPADMLFTSHANLGEKGVAIYVALDSLERGIHRLEFRRYDGDSVKRVPHSKDYRVNLVLPFIVQ